MGRAPDLQFLPYDVDSDYEVPDDNPFAPENSRRNNQNFLDHVLNGNLNTFYNRKSPETLSVRSRSQVSQTFNRLFTDLYNLGNFGASDLRHVLSWAVLEVLAFLEPGRCRCSYLKPWDSLRIILLKDMDFGSLELDLLIKCLAKLGLHLLHYSSVGLLSEAPTLLTLELRGFFSFKALSISLEALSSSSRLCSFFLSNSLLFLDLLE